MACCGVSCFMLLCILVAGGWCWRQTSQTWMGHMMSTSRAAPVMRGFTFLWVQCALQRVSSPTNKHTHAQCTNTRTMSLPHSCNEAIEKCICLKEKIGCARDTSLELTAMLVAVSSLSPVNIHTLKKKDVGVYIGGGGGGGGGGVETINSEIKRGGEITKLYIHDF